VTETAAADDAAAEQPAPTTDWTGDGGGSTEWGVEAGGTDWGVDGGAGDDWGAAAGATDAPATTTNVEEPTERSDRRPRDRDEEEPDNTLTLDQYLAQQKEKSSVIPQLETRKIEQDEGLWKGAKALIKPAEEDSYFVGKVRLCSALSLASAHQDIVQGRSQVSRQEGGEGLLGDRCPIRTPRQGPRPRWPRWRQGSRSW
jgi:plasminogen activator inhibitor 1 RNA-binding protein